MGAWGPGLFSDDLACDIRDEYRELIGDGLPGPEATDRLLMTFADERLDRDSGPVFWLALAATQWKCGRLEERVKTKALEIIETETDLHRWENDSKLAKKRKIVLEKLHTRLLSEQPIQVTIKKAYKQKTSFRLGDIFSYRLKSGKYALFRVVHFHTDKGGTIPIVELCDWTGDRIPPKWQIWWMHPKHPVETWRTSRFLLFEMKERDFPTERVRVIAKQPFILPRDEAAVGIAWTHLDQAIKEWFDLE
jgi:hypothetical protein